MSALGKCVRGTGLLVIMLVSFGCEADKDKVVRHQPQQPKVLNNFVTELLVVENMDGAGVHIFSIDNPREGWCFFRSDAQVGTSGEMKLTISPKDAIGGAAEDEIISRYGPGEKKTAEAMRYLPKGTYTLRLHLKDVELNRLTVRTIPAIIYANFPSDPHLRAFGSYDWAFLKRIGMLDSCNVIIGRGDFMKEWLGLGRQVLQQAGVPGLRAAEPVTAEEAYDYWIKAAGMNDPNMSGIIADEFYTGFSGVREKFPAWIEAIKRVRKERPGKVFYPYIAGEAKGLRIFVEPLLQTDCRFALERYLMEKRTEQEAKRFIENELKNEMIEFKKYAPDFPRRCIYVIGFLCGPNETLNKNPAVSYKVHLDMQFYMLATDAVFEGLYGVEEYLCSYCDEEYLRWCAKLFRHYCIEGSSERLTNDPYELNHIQNPDFEQGLDGWTVEPAAPNSVQVKKMEGYGWLQGRYPQDEQGDIFLWTKRDANKPNVISQQIKNLQPGRYYSVKMYTGDYGELAKNQLHQISLGVEGAEPVPDEFIQGVFANCYSHLIDKFGKTKTYFNYHRVVFRATSETARLVISDWDSATKPAGPAGQEMMFNFIEVEPYLMPD